MAKKEYDVTKRFLEVAERARQTQPQSKKKKPQPEAPKWDQEAYDTRPGRIKGPNSGKDVNLPFERKR